jgi:hypothetical protein
MKRLAVLASVIVLAACGSDNKTVTGTGPTPEIFSGTWVGTFESLVSINIQATQVGTVVSGSGTLTYAGTTYAGTISGTSTPPTLNLTAANGDTTGTYTATWITPDSVAGTFSVDGQSGPLSLKKQ